MNLAVFLSSLWSIIHVTKLSHSLNSVLSLTFHSLPGETGPCSIGVFYLFIHYLLIQGFKLEWMSAFVFVYVFKKNPTKVPVLAVSTHLKGGGHYWDFLGRSHIIVTGSNYVFNIKVSVACCVVYCHLLSWRCLFCYFQVCVYFSLRVDNS